MHTCNEDCTGRQCNSGACISGSGQRRWRRETEAELRRGCIGLLHSSFDQTLRAFYASHHPQPHHGKNRTLQTRSWHAWTFSCTFLGFLFLKRNLKLWLLITRACVSGDKKEGTAIYSKVFFSVASIKSQRIKLNCS